MAIRRHEHYSDMKNKNARLRAGDWVEVRSKEEILRTLDSKGQLNGMPFMPEMFAFCGRRFRIFKSAHKTCDTVFPVRGCRVEDAIHLETRCDGSAHGGCQAGCLIFWKGAWLKKVDDSASSNAAVEDRKGSGCSEAEVWSNTKGAEPDSYACQATLLPYAITKLAWWDMRQYWEDYRSGNVGLRQILNGLVYVAYYELSEAGIGLGSAMRWLYDRLVPLWGGTRFPRHSGKVPNESRTPTASLNLREGELVTIKSQEEILRTVNSSNLNRGLSFDAEMVPYCGGTFRVLKRVTRIIDEKTGKMLEMKNPCIVLDGVVCQARYSDCRMFCPRSIYSYWREIWLERADSSKRTQPEMIEPGEDRLCADARVSEDR